jgi:hypothetical protein
MVFAKTQMGGLDFGFPDVCLTPVLGVPVPIPYPNIAIPMMAIPSQIKILTLAMPDHNLLTITPMSNGDNAGLQLNPASGMVMGPSRNMLGSTGVFICGMPATRMLDMTGQNGPTPGAPGLSLAPSQIKCMILR